MNFRKCWSSKPKEKLKRKTECAGQKLNETDKEQDCQDCQEGSHVETSLPHGLCSTLRSEYTWHGGHKLEREARRGRRLFRWDVQTRASNVKVGARPTAVRNRVHATACWYAGLLGACRRYNGSRVRVLESALPWEHTTFSVTWVLARQEELFFFDRRRSSLPGKEVQFGVHCMHRRLMSWWTSTMRLIR